MYKNKYSTFLTVFLVILIVAILTITTIIIVNKYSEKKDEDEKHRIYAELIEETPPEDEEQNNTNTVNNGDDIIGAPVENVNTNTNNTSSGNDTSSGRKTKFYKEYPVIGYIKIDKTKVDYPILLDVSPGALDVAVGVMYPNNPTLNTPGNILIIGHNYRNGKFFSNNKNLVVGDKIQITDLTGKTLIYTIYDIKTVSSSDTSYVTRDTGGKIEISLSTCTDEGNDRLVILARVE